VPVFIFFVAAIFGLAAINGRVGTLFTQSKTDLFGNEQSYGFIVWAAAILVVASVLKAIDLGDAGKVFVALLIIEFLLGTPDVVNSLEQQLKAAGQGASSGSSTTAPSTTPNQSGGGGSVGNVLSSILGGSGTSPNSSFVMSGPAPNKGS
jgi:hypothetical protein